MADAKESKRLEALMIWVARLSEAGSTTPRLDELGIIAANPTDWSRRVETPLLAAWAPTIDYLMNQLKFGVSPAAAVDQLPEELTRPSSPPPAPTQPAPVPVPQAPTQPAPLPAPETAPPDPGAPVVAALMRWRADRIAAGADGADLIRDATLKNLVKYGHTDAEQIGKKLPGAAAYLSREIAAVIAQFAEAPDEHAQWQPPENPPTRPVPQPRASPTRSERPEGTLLNLTHRDFCDYDYSESSVEPGPITIKGTADGLRLAFEPFIPDAGKMVIYRVVSGDDSAPFKPEAGELVAATTALHVHDSRDLTCAVRTYQVWCHVGIDNEDARRNQPFLIAEGQEVSPVEEFIVREDEGRVIGLWTAYPGTQRVRVFRIPLEGSAPVREDPRNQICVDQGNLTGFVDDQASRGMRYLYRALAEVKVGSSIRLSRARQQEILVSVVLRGVDDMEVALTEDNSRFDLAWTTPEAGRVRVYRLNTPPPAELTGSEMPEAALPVQGFDDEALIRDPVVAADDNRSRIAGVPWPTSWDRAYLVPVTVLGGNARIGATTIKTRPLPPVNNPAIIERFDTEIITFGWPKGATAVRVFVGSATLRPEEICERSHPHAEISRNQYNRDGGLILRRQLEPKGCTVCLVPIAFSQGDVIRGPITPMRYPGLHRLRYALAQPAPEENASPYIRDLWLSSTLDIESPLTLVMVNHPERFPLAPNDGDYVSFIPPHGGERTPQCLIDAFPRGDHPTGWRVDWSRRGGYFRLFIARASDRNKRYALADPPLGALWLEPPGGAQQ